MRGQAGHLRVLGQELLKDRTRAFDENIVGIEHQYHPHRDSHEQRYGRFILILSSKAIARIPKTKMTGIKMNI